MPTKYIKNMMKNFIFSAIIILLYTPSLAISNEDSSNKDICNLRGLMMEFIAQARDEGKSKKQVKKIMRDTLKYKLPPAFDMYLDGVYESSKYSPDQIRKLSVYLCYKEFDLI